MFIFAQVEIPLSSFINLPSEIQQHIASYLNASALSFFAQSDKCRLRCCLSSLVKYQALFSLQLIAKWNSTYFHNKTNQLFVCGSNEYGQLGLGDNEHRSTFTILPWPENQGWIERVITGGSHAIMLTRDNKLWVCGHNGFGQLGLRDTKNRFTFKIVSWPEDRGKIQKVIIGNNYTIVLTEYNKLWVCRCNSYGQLGLNNQMKHSTFTLVEILEVFSFNQLIKICTALTLVSDIKSNTIHSQHQLDEPDGQPPLKKMRL